jgi:hypothetical protein
MTLELRKKARSFGFINRGPAPADRQSGHEPTESNHGKSHGRAPAVFRIGFPAIQSPADKSVASYQPALSGLQPRPFNGNPWNKLFPWALVLTAGVAYYLSGPRNIPFTAGPFHHHLAQAEAFLAGRLHLESHPPNVELGFHEGRSCVVLPPGPAILLMPLVALAGSHVNLLPVHALLSALSVALIFQTLRKRGNTATVAVTASAAFAFGTVHWWVTKEIGAWHTAHVVAVFCLCLAVRLAHAGRVPILVGFLVGFAAISRQLTLFAAPYLLYRVFASRANPDKIRPISTNQSLVPASAKSRESTPGWIAAQFLIGFSLPLAFYLAINYARFGNPFDTGYRFINLQPPGLDKYLAHGLFSIAYLPENLFTVLFAPPRWGDVFPWFFPDYFGQALVFTSPFLLYAFRPGLRSREHRILWLSILAIFIPQLFYFNNGFAQFGYRFALDFLPLTMLLVADGFGPRPSPGAVATVLLAVTMNLLGVYIL